MTNEKVLKLIEDGRIIPIQIKANDEKTSKYNLENLEVFNVITKALKQESMLDKIKAEIQNLRNCSCSCSDGIIDDVEDILDKYKAESEG